jgi:hypothetical protein
VYSKTKCSSSNIFCFRSCLSLFSATVFACLAHKHSHRSSCLASQAYRQCRGFVFYTSVENVSHNFLRLSPLQYHQHRQRYFICNFRISRNLLKLCGSLTIFLSPPVLSNFIHVHTRFRRFLDIFSTRENNFPIYRIFNFADTIQTQLYTEVLRERSIKCERKFSQNIK